MKNITFIFFFLYSYCSLFGNNLEVGIYGFSTGIWKTDEPERLKNLHSSHIASTLATRDKQKNRILYIPLFFKYINTKSNIGIHGAYHSFKNSSSFISYSNDINDFQASFLSLISNDNSNHYRKDRYINFIYFFAQNTTGISLGYRDIFTRSFNRSTTAFSYFPMPVGVLRDSFLVSRYLSEQFSSSRLLSSGVGTIEKRFFTYGPQISVYQEQELMSNPNAGKEVGIEGVKINLRGMISVFYLSGPYKSNYVIADFLDINNLEGGYTNLYFPMTNGKTKTLKRGFELDLSLALHFGLKVKFLFGVVYQYSITSLQNYQAIGTTVSNYPEYNFYTDTLLRLTTNYFISPYLTKPQPDSVFRIYIGASYSFN